MVVTLNVDLAKKIGEGGCREVYQWNNLAIKVLKPTLRKRILGIPFHFPLNAYVKLKFGIDDFNREELYNFETVIECVPEELRDSFSDVYGVGILGGRNYSVCELVRNADGSLSRALCEYEHITDPFFKQRLKQLEGLFAEQNICLVDIRAHNFVVMEEKERMVPVMVDYKRNGHKVYRLKPWIWSERQIRTTIRDRFEKLIEKYCF